MERNYEFAEEIARRLGEVLLSVGKILVVGPRDILLDGQNINLEDLYRMCSGRDKTYKDKTINKFIRNLSLAGFSMPPFESVKNDIFPAICSDNRLNSLGKDIVYSKPYVNGTHVALFIDFDECTKYIKYEDLIRWGSCPDALEMIAKCNLKTEELDLIESRSSMGRILKSGSKSRFASAYLLLDEFRDEIREKMRGDFKAAIPSRNTLVVIPAGKSDLETRISSRVKTAYESNVFPITPEWFYVTLDGVAGTIDKEPDN